MLSLGRPTDSPACAQAIAMIMEIAAANLNLMVYPLSDTKHADCHANGLPIAASYLDIVTIIVTILVLSWNQLP